MNSNLKKVLSIIIVIIIVFGWYVTVFGIGNISSVKDGLKLGLDIKGGVYVLLEAQTDAAGDELKQIMEQTQAVIENRVNQMGLSEPVVTIEGEKRIRVELPGAEDAQDAIDAIGKTAQLVFCLADGSFILDGGDVKDAGITTDQQHGGYAVALEFTPEGSAAFAEGTRMAINGVNSSLEGVHRNSIAIILDDEIISAPVVEEVINTGNCIITSSRVGGYPQEEAAELAALIRGGALPVDLEEKEYGTQTATIGETAFEKSIVAGAIGLVLIFIILIAGYSIMGIAASLALLLYVIIVLWLMVAMQSVLTLPGIAGIILSIGMAVDANVIIFSRIREEILNGKSIRVSVQSGFKRALATVLDSQITTIIAAVVLYQVGTSSVKGFALTLMIGIIASIFTAVVVTNLFISVMAESKKFSNKKYYGIKSDGTAKFAFKKDFEFIKHKNKFYIFSVAIILIGLLLGMVRGMNYGIDFTGGTMLQINMGTHVSEEDVNDVLKTQNIDDAQIIYAGENGEQIIIRTINFLDNDERGVVIDALQDEFGFDDNDVLSSEQFSPSVGTELQKNAVLAVLIASIGMLIYIIIRFEWKFGVASLVGVFHDVFMVIAFYSIFHITINNPFIAGILTVVGYSINDTIVIFDRVRENLTFMKKSHTEELINKSINQTLARSLMTSITTLIVMIPLYILTSSAIRAFTVPLMIGIIVGCMSSITVCSPVYYDLCKLTGGTKYRAKKSKKKNNKLEHKDKEE